MKKLLMMIALCGFPMAVLTGCGTKKAETVEASSTEDTGMTVDAQQQYEEQMKSMSSSPGN